MPTNVGATGRKVSSYDYSKTRMSVKFRSTATIAPIKLQQAATTGAQNLLTVLVQNCKYRAKAALLAFIFQNQQSDRLG